MCVICLYAKSRCDILENSIELCSIFFCALFLFCEALFIFISLAHTLLLNVEKLCEDNDLMLRSLKAEMTEELKLAFNVMIGIDFFMIDKLIANDGNVFKVIVASFFSHNVRSNKLPGTRILFCFLFWAACRIQF